MRKFVAVIFVGLAWIVPAVADSPDSAQQVKAAEESNTCDSYYPPDNTSTGTTYMVVHVEKSGRIQGVRLARSSGDYDLDKAAFRCADHLRILEARKILKPLEFDWISGIVWAGHGRAYLIIPSPRTGTGNDCTDMAIPPSVRDAHPVGTTEVRFHINLVGLVEDAVVAQSSGHPALDELSLRCVQRFTYMPAYHNYQRIVLEWAATVSWDFR